MWWAVIAGIAFQQRSVDSLLRELNGNTALLVLCGFNRLPVQRQGADGATQMVDTVQPECLAVSESVGGPG